MRGHTLSVALGLALFCGASGAAGQDDEVQQIPVQGVKNPEMKSYRAVWAGLEMFDKEHGLAPAVPELRFRILTKNSKVKCTGICATSNNQLPDPSDQGLALRIASDDEAINVPVAPDGLFTVPRSEAAYDANADLLLNRKKGTYKIMPEVRTPGLPDNVRRLGDLRLECKVQVAIIKEEIPLWVVALANSILLTRDWCSYKTGEGHIKWSYSTFAPVQSAMLVHGDRSQKLETGKRSFTIEIDDRSWPDDALVQLEYAAE